MSRNLVDTFKGRVQFIFIFKILFTHPTVQAPITGLIKILHLYYYYVNSKQHTNTNSEQIW